MQPTTEILSSSPVNNECPDVSSSITQDFTSKLMLMVDDVNDLKTEVNSDEEEEKDSDDEDFSFTCLNPYGSPIGANDCFQNGQIRPIFPIFGRDLLFSNLSDEDSKPKESSFHRPALRKLFIEENDAEPSSLEEVSPERCRKSSSKGFSKIWRFRDHFVPRSNSDGEDAFVFCNNNPSCVQKREKSVKVEEKDKRRSTTTATAAEVQERQYVRNRAKKAGDKRRTYLPYRQDIVGFFTSVNGLTRNTHPF